MLGGGDADAVHRGQSLRRHRRLGCIVLANASTFPRRATLTRALTATPSKRRFTGRSDRLSDVGRESTRRARSHDQKPLNRTSFSALVLSTRPGRAAGSVRRWRAQPARLRRLAEELFESGLRADGTDAVPRSAHRGDRSRAPSAVHERRIPSAGHPRADVGSSHLASGTQLEITRGRLINTARGRAPFRDGLRAGSYAALTARTSGWCSTDPRARNRSCRTADVLDAAIIQRHPAGLVRVVGRFGVLRWEGLRWHHELRSAAGSTRLPRQRHGDRDVLEAMFEFAIHDWARWNRPLLIYRPQLIPALRSRSGFRHRLRCGSERPRILHRCATRSHKLMALRLRRRRSPTAARSPARAEQRGRRQVDALGAPHTSGRRYSHDDRSPP